MQKSSTLIKKAAFTAVMAALGCALAYVPRLFTADSAGRIDLAILPVLFVAQLCGPLWSAAGYVITDLVGCLFSGYAPFPPITLCKLAGGLVIGFGFHKKTFSLGRCLLWFGILALSVDVVLMTPALRLLQGRPWLYYLWVRPLTAALNFGVRLLFVLTVGRAAQPTLRRFAGILEREDAFMRYANSFQAVPRLGLDRIRQLLSFLGNPHEGGRFIHVAGTNGKGSVCMACAAALAHAGYRVGLYISPNLVRVNERISICGEPISEKDLQAYMRVVEQAAAQLQSHMGEMPSQFELWTACAFLYFKERGCAYVVLETGLGGEFDATNAIVANEIAVLTRIDLDHTALLGHSLAEIAHAKCGIFKEACATGTVISAPQDKEVKAVIEREAAQKGLGVRFVDRPAPSRFTDFYEIIDYDDIRELRLPFAGVHQIENICTAIEALQALGIPSPVIEAGLAKAKHPARMELLREAPPMLYDGAHNPNGMDALCASLARYAPGTKWTVIFAAMADKDITPSLARLAPFADRFLFTTVSENPRALSPQALAQKARECGVEGIPCGTLSEAIALCAEAPTVICGSLYLYADLDKSLLC